MVPEILHHLGQASVVAELKLGRLKLTVFLVAAGIGAAAAEICETPSSRVRPRMAAFSRVDMIRPV